MRFLDINGIDANIMFLLTASGQVSASCSGDTSGPGVVVLQDAPDFNGERDVKHPVVEWNAIEAVAGDVQVTFLLKGVKVNEEGTHCSPGVNFSFNRKVRNNISDALHFNQFSLNCALSKIPCPEKDMFKFQYHVTS